MEHRVANPTDAQSSLIASLQDPDIYPHPVSSIELFETHISWVILTGSFAYKIKKAVDLDFLDFSTLDLRRHYCEEELRLNKQWAPELYLEVLPICGSYDRPMIGGDDRVIEYAVKMVQFPQSAQLDNQLNAGLLQEKDLYELAETIAGYHEKAKIIEYANDKESVRKVTAPMLENFTPLKQAIDMDLLARVQQWTATSLRELKPALIQRRKDGFVRECHGDLHLANLVRSAEGIVAFDCVEFSAELRNIDVISDVAFLVMDLVAHARQDLAFVFLKPCCRRTLDRWSGAQTDRDAWLFRLR
jgi:aminoglycoside phosphotransferase family enzyme